MALTKKQKLFVGEYLIDLNATQAAIRAGYSPDTAKEIGCENLTKPNIRNEIEKRMAERSRRTGINQDRVLIELAEIGFARVTDFVEIVDGRVKIKNTGDVDPERIAAIAGIKEGANGIEIKLNDKGKALEMIGRHLGMFSDRVEVSGKVEKDNPYAGLTTEELKKLIHGG